MKIKFNMDIDDMMESIKFRYCAFPEARKLEFKYGFIGVLFGLIFLNVFLFLIGKSHANVLFLSLIIFVVWIPTTYLLSSFQNKNKHLLFLQKLVLYNDRNVRMTLGKQVMELMPDGISVIANKSSTLIKYAEIKKMEVTSTHIFICILPRLIYGISKAKVVEGDLDAFITAIKEKILSVSKIQPVASR